MNDILTNNTKDQKSGALEEVTSHGEGAGMQEPVLSTSLISRRNLLKAGVVGLLAGNSLEAEAASTLRTLRLDVGGGRALVLSSKQPVTARLVDHLSYLSNVYGLNASKPVTVADDGSYTVNVNDPAGEVPQDVEIKSMPPLSFNADADVHRTLTAAYLALHFHADGLVDDKDFRYASTTFLNEKAVRELISEGLDDLVLYWSGKLSRNSKDYRIGEQGLLKLSNKLKEMITAPYNANLGTGGIYEKRSLQRIYNAFDYFVKNVPRLTRSNANQYVDNFRKSFGGFVDMELAPRILQTSFNSRIDARTQVGVKRDFAALSRMAVASSVYSFLFGEDKLPAICFCMPKTGGSQHPSYRIEYPGAQGKIVEIPFHALYGKDAGDVPLSMQYRAVDAKLDEGMSVTDGAFRAFCASVGLARGETINARGAWPDVSSVGIKVAAAGELNSDVHVFKDVYEPSVSKLGWTPVQQKTPWVVVVFSVIYISRK